MARNKSVFLNRYSWVPVISKWKQEDQKLKDIHATRAGQGQPAWVTWDPH